ncbi:EamA family transporter [Rhodoferax koreense]|uniref:EamA family transporter n=1 Tax=Rhodoferax koreensis TaxID=1842727 RepID=A0A1P8JZ50_9BURK|nr:DMT family transporter [Rhodoferax koreense]APW39015.1 EamA family transporter [Rhodoferax koreense]
MNPAAGSAQAATANAWLRVMPAVFVVIWSTGFIVARYGMPHAPPLKFLALRFGLSVLCFGVWARMSRAAWPSDRGQWKHLAVTGMLMHAMYLGGVWSAVKLGMGAGLIALLVGLQPVLTAVWVSARGGRVGKVQWLGLAFGLAGLALVVWQKLGLGEIHPFNFLLALGALLSITVGTLYQKRFLKPCAVPTANLVQNLAACVVTWPLAVWLEQESIHFNAPLIASMAWSVLVLTLGGSSLLYLLIQRGAATAVTSLLYLVPPTTALMAWVLFGEPITVLTLAGTALTALGVSLVVRSRH